MLRVRQVRVKISCEDTAVLTQAVDKVAEMLESNGLVVDRHAIPSTILGFSQEITIAAGIVESVIE